MLKIENLHVSIEGKEILKGLSLDVKPGEIHAIMGPNGSGKSTLSSVIAGNEDYEVVKGNIFYNGENIEDLSADERANRGIFMSFQYPVAIPGITVTNFIKTAVLMKLVTVIPGIATGYWNDIKIPLFALSSAERSSIFSPL